MELHPTVDSASGKRLAEGDASASASGSAAAFDTSGDRIIDSAAGLDNLGYDYEIENDERTLVSDEKEQQRQRHQHRLPLYPSESLCKVLMNRNFL